MAAFWAKREDKEAYEEKKCGQLRGPGFWVAGRGLSAAEKKMFPWATIMRDTTGELLLPDVFLAPIDQTNFVVSLRMSLCQVIRKRAEIV